MAVPIFMVISGYLYTKSFERHGVDSFDKAYEKKSLFIKILRFTVPFSVAFILEEVFLIIVNKSFEPWEFLIRFLNGGKGPGSYYYPVMIQFIFYFPVIYFIVKKYAEKGFVSCLAINFVYELLQRAYGMNEECYRMLVFRYTFVIAFGCYLASSEKNINIKLLGIFEGVGLVYIIVFKYIGITPPITRYWTGTSYLASMFIVPITYFLIKKTKLSFKPLDILGKASFDVFLMQMVFYSFFAGIVYGVVEHSLIRIVGSLVICCIGGIVFYFC